MSDIKLKAASGGGSISLKGPSSLGSDRDLVDTSGNINLLDNQKLKAGDSADLTLEHRDNNWSYITHSGSGNLAIESVNSMYLRNSSGEIYFYGEEDSYSAMYHNNAKKIETTSTGVTVTGNLKLASTGQGIDFSATSDANGKDNELLDDYEEGTWNPAYDETSVTASSYHSNRGGNYTKIGNLVTFTAYVQMTSSTVTGNPISLEGLPFTSHSSKMQGSASFGYADNWGGSSSSATAPITMHVGLNESKIRFYDGDGNQIDANNVYDGAKRGIHIRGFYYV